MFLLNQTILLVLKQNSSIDIALLTEAILIFMLKD